MTLRQRFELQRESENREDDDDDDEDCAEIKLASSRTHHAASMLDSRDMAMVCPGRAYTERMAFGCICMRRESAALSEMKAAQVIVMEDEGEGKEDALKRKQPWLWSV